MLHETAGFDIQKSSTPCCEKVTCGSVFCVNFMNWMVMITPKAIDRRSTYSANPLRYTHEVSFMNTSEKRKGVV